jgi:putative inorganic carbon (HCO3(-)) transporter
MRKWAFAFVWLIVFAMPWEDMWVFPGIGTITRIVGVPALVIGLLAVAHQGYRIRRPAAFHYAVGAFVVWSILTLTWSMDPPMSLIRLLTYLQLGGMVWLIWEYADTPEHQIRLLGAYVLGAYVSVLSTLSAFITQHAVVDERYAASNYEPGGLALIFAIGIPPAWYLALTRKHDRLRPLYWFYPPLAIFSILLTGSRGASVTAGLAVLFIILTYPHLKRIGKVLVPVSAICAGLLTWAYVPPAAFQRLGTTAEEATSGDWNARLEIWKSGSRIFRDHLFGGTGVWAFPRAVEPMIGYQIVAHSSFLSVLFETGIIGFLLYCSAIVLAFATICKLSGLQRLFWIMMMLTWVVGVSTLNWEHSKITWLLLAVLYGQNPLLPANIRHTRTVASTSRGDRPRIEQSG